MASPAKNPHLAEQWRYRDHELPGMEGEGDDVPRPRGIAEYAYTIQGREVHYSRKTSSPGDIAFIDHGRRIEIQDWRNRESVLAALQLSQEKWGSITVTGNEQYKAICAELAAEHGFKIVNAELHAAIGALSQAQTAERQSEEKVQERMYPQPTIITRQSRDFERD